MTMDEALDHYLPNYRGRFADRFSAARRHALGYATEVRADRRAGGRSNSLEQFTGFKSRGLNAAQIYAQKIRPRLSQPQRCTTTSA